LSGFEDLTEEELAQADSLNSSKEDIISFKEVLAEFDRRLKTRQEEDAELLQLL
jgi:phosphopentomutase